MIEEERLRSSLSELAPHVDVDADWDALQARLRRQRRRSHTVVAAAAALLVVVGAAVLFGLTRPDDQQVATRPGAPRGWTELRGSPVEGWPHFDPSRPDGRGKGDREQVAPGGAAFDPTTGTWTVLPEAPIAPRREPVAVWTGREMIIWGGQLDAPDGAAYEPRTRTWRPLPKPPVLVGLPNTAVWTGEELVLWGQRQSAGGVAYDPDADRWRRIADAPFVLEPGSAVWAATEMVVLGGIGDQIKIAAYDPAVDRWRMMPAPALSPSAPSLVWTGQSLLAFDYELHAATYDEATSAWTDIAPIPVEFRECAPQGAVLGGVVLVTDCDGAALYDVATTGWTAVDVPRNKTIVQSVPVTGGDGFYLWLADSASYANTQLPASPWRYTPVPRG